MGVLPARFLALVSSLGIAISAACAASPAVTLDHAALELGFARTVSGDRWLADFDRGWWRSAGAEATAQAGQRLERGPWRGRLVWRAALGRDLPARGRILAGWIGLSGRHWSVRAGRASPLWSPLGAALLISPHARPLDLLQASFVSPAFRRGIGRWEAETFVGRLDDPVRTVPNPLLWGMRASWVPVEGVRIEALRSIMLGGEGRGERLQPRDLWDIFLGRGETSTAEAPGPENFPAAETDQKFAWQITLRAPAPLSRALGLHDLEALWTYAGEDRFRGIAPTAPARAYALRIQPGPRLALMAAYVNLVDDGNLWYRHKIYLSGYTYRGVVLGHPAGGDARSLRLSLLAAPGSLRLRLEAVREERGYRFADRGMPAGGFWSGCASASVPVAALGLPGGPFTPSGGPGRTRWEKVRLRASLGAADPWGADRARERLAEVCATLGIEWTAEPVHAEISREEAWGDTY